MANVGQPITRDKWLATEYSRRNRSLESSEMLVAPPDSGLAFPCRWKHIYGRACDGSKILLGAARKHGMKIHTRCKGGTLHMWKEASSVGPGSTVTNQGSEFQPPDPVRAKTAISEALGMEARV